MVIKLTTKVNFQLVTRLSGLCMQLVPLQFLIAKKVGKTSKAIIVENAFSSDSK